MKQDIGKNTVTYNAHSFIKMKNFCLFCVLTLLIGCTFREYISLYNNTGSQLQIAVLENGVKKEVIIEKEEIGYFEISSLPAGGIDIAINGDIWKYQWNYFEISHFMKQEGFGPWSKIVYRFQIESNRRIYALRPTDEYILNDLSNQPLGYPLNGVSPHASD